MKRILALLKRFLSMWTWVITLWLFILPASVNAAPFAMNEARTPVYTSKYTPPQVYYKYDVVKFEPCTRYKFYDVTICGDYPFQYRVYQAMLKVSRAGYVPYVRANIARIEQTPKGAWPNQMGWVKGNSNIRAIIYFDFTQAVPDYDYLSAVIIHEAEHGAQARRGEQNCGRNAEYEADLVAAEYAKRARVNYIPRPRMSIDDLPRESCLVL